jgi:transcriptional antiterminator NusG
MTDENSSVSNDNSPHTESTSAEAVASGDGSNLPEIPDDSTVAHKTAESEIGEHLPGESETSGEHGPNEAVHDESGSGETTKSTSKKPRKSSKSASAEKESPAESLQAAGPGSAGGAEGASEHSKKWYVVKVQSGREDSIKAAIERKVKIEGLEDFFGQIAIPVEEIIQKKSVRVTDKKTGDKVTQEKKVIKYQKKFPGYLFAEVEFNDRILYLFRETSGVGDFVGASLKRDPTPMTEREVRAMFTGVVEGDLGKPGQKQKVKLEYEKGDKVKIRDGAFANMEGVVKSISDTKDTGETPKVEVVVTIFGRPVEVILDYWHVDKT